jgi:uncharacterized spore protein YtfJ
VDVNEVLRRAGEVLYVGRSFGPAYERGGTLVIPVAVVAGGGGGGVRGIRGGLGARVEQYDQGEQSPENPDESGGGFGGLVYPVGAYVVSEGRARFVPSVDVNLALVCGLLVSRLVLKRLRRRRR